MKKCPHCGEQIQDSAKKCRFCGEWLEIKNTEKVEVKDKKPQTIKADINSIRKKRKIGWILALSLVGIGIVRILVSALFWIIGASEGGLLEVIKTFINWVLGLLSLIGIPATIVGIIMLFNNPKKGYDIYVPEDLKGLPEEQIKFINSFSRGGFFSPTIMLFYTKKYIWAIICLILDLAGVILGIIPRAIVGGGARKWAYKNSEKTFEELKSSTKKIEKISIVIGIIRLAIVIGILVSYNSEQKSRSNTSTTSNYSVNNIEWKDFNSTLGKFKIQLPTYPKSETSNIDLPTSDLDTQQISYISDVSNELSYLIYVFLYPQDSIDTSNPQANLEGSLNGMLTSTAGNELVSSEFTIFNGYDALSYKILNSSENIYLQGKLILVGNTLYNLIVAYATNNQTNTNYEKFINSFELIE